MTLHRALTRGRDLVAPQAQEIGQGLVDAKRPAPWYAVFLSYLRGPMAASSTSYTLADPVYRWVTPIARLAKQRQLGEGDLFQLPDQLRATHDARAFEAAFSRHEASGRLSLVRTIVYVFRGEIVRIFCLSIFMLAPQFFAPLLLREVLRGIQGESHHPPWFTQLLAQWLGYTPSYVYPLVCSLALVTCSIVSILAIHRLFFIQPTLAKRITNVLTHEIFCKSLRQHRSEQAAFSNGYIVNLVASDCQRIGIFGVFMHSTWYHPLALCIATLILYNLVGAPGLYGACTLVLILLCCAPISWFQGRLRKKLLRLADSRITTTREALLHIKAAKMQGWEENLIGKIQRIRLKEVAVGRSLARISSTLLFLSSLAPAMAMAVAATSMVHRGVSLDAATIFPMLSLFSLLRFAMGALPETIYNLVEAYVSLGRIERFFESRERVSVNVDTRLPHAVVMRNVRCHWPDGSLALDVPDLTINKGELIVIVGSVGSGKSSLLLTILGELTPSEGIVSVGGTIGYVSQNPWIVSESIRDNVTSGFPFEASRYRRAIRASGLGPDLASFPSGDLTEIGERGINLSGGQRHRVALARALYRGGDLLLFDDPLSALDPDVANQVFEQLIQGELAQATRIVVSHRVEYALAADRVLVVEDGRIIESGSPRELRSKDSRFSELLRFHEKVTLNSTSNAVEKAAAEPTIEHDEIDITELDDEPSAHARLIVSEERSVGAVRRSISREYLVLIAPTGALTLLAALFLSRNLASLFNDLWLTISSNIGSISGPLNPSVFLLGYVVSIIVLSVVTYLRASYVLTRGLGAGVATHEGLLRGVLRAPMRFFESNPVGRILNRFSRDLETVELHLPRCILDAGSCLGDTLLVCVVVAVVAPVTFVAMVPAAIAYVIAFRLYRPISRDIQRLFSTTLSPVFAVLSESLAGRDTIRSSGLAGRFTTKFEKALDSNSRVLLSQTGANRWIGVRLELIGTAIILVVSVAVSVNLDAFMGVAFSGLALSYANSMTGAMNWAIRSLSMVENSLTSYERMRRYSDTTPEPSGNSPKPIEWPQHGAISFRNVSARYRPELPLAISDISYEVPAGARLGIIGRSGSGKSTLILALLRLVEPCGGSIQIDGVDLSTLSLRDLRTSIAVVPQEPVLFSGTLRESLDPFSEYSDNEIFDALRRVELKSFFESLPLGLETRVHEGGFNFSAGQRQLICLARALLRRSKVIVLDEATASIDVQTDFAIQRAIRQECKGATVLVVAHRLGTIADSDFILALQNGRLVEAGRPETLLDSSSTLFRDFIVDSQLAEES